MLIAIEGPDGCGKSTIAKALAERLEARSLAFPDRRTPLGRHVDAMLKQPDHDPYVMQALQTANRLEHINALTFYAGASDRNLVLDRYWQSGYVYSVAAGLERGWVRNLTERAVPPADVNVLISTPVAESYARRKTGPGCDQYDGRPIEWHRCIAELYRELWASKQGTGAGAWVEVRTDGLSAEDVAGIIVHRIGDAA